MFLRGTNVTGESHVPAGSKPARRSADRREAAVFPRFDPPGPTEFPLDSVESVCDETPTAACRRRGGTSGRAGSDCPEPEGQPESDDGTQCECRDCSRVFDSADAFLT